MSTQFPAHVSRANHTQSTPVWKPPGRYAGPVQKHTDLSGHALSNRMSDQQGRVEAARERLKAKIENRKGSVDQGKAALDAALFALGIKQVLDSRAKK